MPALVLHLAWIGLVLVVWAGMHVPSYQVDLTISETVWPVCMLAMLAMVALASVRAVARFGARANSMPA